MSTGTFHFREAERLLNGTAEDIAEALVHAKLADVAVNAHRAGLVHNTNGKPSEWWTALRGEERS